MKNEMNPEKNVMEEKGLEELEKVNGGGIWDYTCDIGKIAVELVKKGANAVMDAAGEVPLDAMGGV